MNQRCSIVSAMLFMLLPFARAGAWQAAGDVTKDSSATISSSADRVGEPAAAPNPDSTAAVASAPAEPLPAKRPLGWLSDPGKAPENIFEAIFTGKIHLDNRLRLELADTTAKDSSTAITNRLRLGYETKAFHGLSGMIEMESVVTPDKGNYFVPQTMQGTSSRTVVADPVGTEVNQAWGRFMAKAIGDSAVSLDLKVGRQRVKLDDERFIGAVGWRQFEQTLDAVTVRSNLGVERLSVFYAYVWRVERIFGPDGSNPDSDSHLTNVSYRFAPEFKVTPFVYLLDFKDDEPANSVNNYGLSLGGDVWRDAADESDVWFDYDLTLARQEDAGANPVDYQADFVGVQGRVNRKGLGFLMVGYQLLGSDDGRAAFRFPLGTNHAFQGLADNFLTTPKAGVNDLYFGIGGELPLGLKAAATFHQFWTDEGDDDLGSEWDFVVSKSITPNWSALVKGAFYDGDSGQPDTTRVWLQTEFKF